MVPEEQRDFSHIPDLHELPNLIRVQLDSYKWFLRDGLKELFNEISPIQDFTGNRMELVFGDYRLGDPPYSDRESRQRDLTYSAPLRATVQLIVKESGEVKEQELFLGDFPLMTSTGTFVINGAERVVVSQLVRSPGVYFSTVTEPTTGRVLCAAKLIPNRGAWLEFETSTRDLLTVKVDRKRKIPVTTLLRAIDTDPEIEDETLLGTDERIRAMLADAGSTELHPYLEATIAKEAAPPEDGERNKTWALLEVYRRLRPGDPPTADNARGLLDSLFFNPRRYDLGRVGRYKLNKRLHKLLPDHTEERTLRLQDLLAIVKQQIRVNNGEGEPDDIDHLGNRRIRAVGELIQNQFRVGLLRMERVVRERMTITDPDQATPSALINIRPVVAAMKEFFGGSQLSQFMDQTNPLAELTHKRRLSALGPGGLSRDRAGFDVRDVHHSHYGRICPIETPEGPNIGLIGSLATFGVINDFGFIQTPYRRVIRELPAQSRDLVGRILREDLEGPRGGAIGAANEVITAGMQERIASAGIDAVALRPYVTDEIAYLTADEEDAYVVAQATSPLDEQGHFLEERVEVRDGERFEELPPEQVDYMDVSPRQIVSVATSLIPFLEHDDANRALMGSNMQRQAVPLVRPEVPLVSTGMERPAAYDSGQVIFARKDGEVISATSDNITVRYRDGEEEAFRLLKFMRSNQGTCINQRPIVAKGDSVTAGQPLADSSSTDQGELALGQSVLVAFMAWEGYNFEDAIIVSESLVKDDKFTSIHMSKHEVEARDTKLGPEEITRDIPNVGEESLRDLDENGIIRIGAEVDPGDILVGKITPKGETELTAEEKLLRAIFGEKAREVKDTSLRVPHGVRGTVVEVRVFRREDRDELPAGVEQMVRVTIAERRKLSEGDKMAGRHGNKGVISRILAAEDMPYLEDGTPVDIILNPIGVPSRMNLGQVLETQLGWAARTLGFRAVSPVFDGATEAAIEDAMARAWLVRAAGAATGAPAQGSAWYDRERVDNWLRERGYDPALILDDGETGVATRAGLELWLESIGEKRVRGLTREKLTARSETAFNEGRGAPPIFGKQWLYDGRSGDRFDQPVSVGYIYMMKLSHMVEDKIHARSTGPYSLITQQPLGGKAQFGGQRFGEMEVWALEAYGAAHILQELLTVKSDDVIGRVKAYEAIVKGEMVLEPGVPESFKVLVKELQSLGLSVEVLNRAEERVEIEGAAGQDLPELGVNLSGFEGEDVTHA
ncbi:MAG: DNA-directed RNA polymerase subunit beta [Dehalococcoidia bacterium]